MTFSYLGVNYQRQNVIPVIREYCLINDDLGRNFLNYTIEYLY